MSSWIKERSCFGSIGLEQALRSFGLRIILLLTVTPLNSLLPAASNADNMDSVEWFEKKIRPILVKHCYECHSASSKTLGGKLRLDLRDGLLTGGESGPAVSIGKPDSSLLILALKYDGLEMPPSGKLPDSVIADFEKWIEFGLPDPRSRPTSRESQPDEMIANEDLWSLQPIVTPQIPATTSAAQGVSRSRATTTLSSGTSALSSVGRSSGDANACLTVSATSARGAGPGRKTATRSASTSAENSPAEPYRRLIGMNC